MKIRIFNKTPEKEIKISQELFNEVLELVNASIEDETIDNFIENAIKYKINRIKYNLENYDSIVSKDGLLIASNQKSFTKCIFCEKLFLNYTSRNREGKRICQRCTQMIKYFAKQI